MKQIFISHRSIDKKFADILESFLVKCGIASDSIFCSSLPGNDIKQNISGEIKEALKESIIDIIILSNDYYESAYCQNEIGIIWFKDDTKKIVICLPEINEHTMQGFLNNDYKIRRMNSKEDIDTICDTVKPIFSGFLQSTAKLNSYITQLINEYAGIVAERKHPIQKANNSTNEIESKILANAYSVDELIMIKYVFETDTNIIYDDFLLINKWLSKYGISREINEDVTTCMLDEGILLTVKNDFDFVCGYKFRHDIYRQIRQLSQTCIESIDKSFSKYQNRHETVMATLNNSIDNLIADGFMDEEILMIKYIRDCEKTHLLDRWLAEAELSSIKAWEEINQLDSFLQNNYHKVLSKFLIRKFADASALTSYNNPKEYKIRDEILDMIKSISAESLAKIEKVATKHKREIEDELPF